MAARAWSGSWKSPARGGAPTRSGPAGFRPARPLAGGLPGSSGAPSRAPGGAEGRPGVGGSAISPVPVRPHGRPAPVRRGGRSRGDGGVVLLAVPRSPHLGPGDRQVDGGALMEALLHMKDVRHLDRLRSHLLRQLPHGPGEVPLVPSHGPRSSRSSWLLDHRRGRLVQTGARKLPPPHADPREQSVGLFLEIGSQTRSHGVDGRRMLLRIAWRTSGPGHSEAANAPARGRTSGLSKKGT